MALVRAVMDANLALAATGLAAGTWGNASGIDRQTGIVVIKPSGVPYDALTTDSMAVLDLAGNILTGAVRPSSDTPTHLELYRRFPELGGIVHTHSRCATAWAQAGRSIPVHGTTHADCFAAAVPCTRPLSPAEIDGDYEVEIGRVIAECLGDRPPLDDPAVLVHGHGPFTWGADVRAAVAAAEALELVAGLAFDTLVLDAHATPIGAGLQRRHFTRKHGPDAYYGQHDGDDPPR